MQLVENEIIALYEDVNHSYAFKIKDNDYIIKVDDVDTFLVDCGATTHIVNKDTNFVYI